MKKFIILIIFTLIPVISFSTVSAQTTYQNQNTACNSKSNGQDCLYKVQLFNQNPEPADISGNCDRRGNGTLYCNNTLTGWEDCFNKSQPNDACKNSSGQSGTCKRQGNGDNFTCDTNKTPPGNPGGSTPATCDGKTCPSNQVCANQGGKPTCTANAASSDGKCDGKTCTPNQICINQGNPPKPTCTANASTPGTPANTNPTDATAPQTVGFINPIRFNSLTELIAGIINALLGILGAITVGVLVYSGFQYMISSDPGAVGKALDGIKNAIVGLMIIMGAFLITQYVISALAGSSTAPPPPNSPPDNSNQNPPNPAPKPAPNPAPNPEKCGGKTCKPNEGCLEDASGNPTCISCDFLGC